MFLEARALTSPAKEKASFTFHLIPPTSLAPYLINFSSSSSSPRTRPSKSHCSRIYGENVYSRSRAWVINQTGNLISVNENTFPIFSDMGKHWHLVFAHVLRTRTAFKLCKGAVYLKMQFLQQKMVLSIAVWVCGHPVFSRNNGGNLSTIKTSILGWIFNQSTLRKQRLGQRQEDLCEV